MVSSSGKRLYSFLIFGIHWLPIHKRINFKVAILTYKVLSTQQPAYLYNLISYHQPSRSLRSSSQSLLQVPRVKPISDAVLFPLLLLKSGIIIPAAIKVSPSLDSFKVQTSPQTHTILPRRNFLTT